MRPKEEEMWLQTSAFFFLVYSSQNYYILFSFSPVAMLQVGAGAGRRYNSCAAERGRRRGL